jgi:hypothetical protein
MLLKEYTDQTTKHALLRLGTVKWHTAVIFSTIIEQISGVVLQFHILQHINEIHGTAPSVQQSAIGWMVKRLNAGEGKIFCNCPERTLGPPSLLYSGYWISFPRVKQPGHDIDHQPLSRWKKEYISGTLWPIVGRTSNFSKIRLWVVHTPRFRFRFLYAHQQLWHHLPHFHATSLGNTYWIWFSLYVIPTEKHKWRYTYDYITTSTQIYIASVIHARLPWCQWMKNYKHFGNRWEITYATTLRYTLYSPNSLSCKILAQPRMHMIMLNKQQKTTLKHKYLTRLLKFVLYIRCGVFAD